MVIDEFWNVPQIVKLKSLFALAMINKIPTQEGAG
jgi:hypothetical protein